MFLSQYRAPLASKPLRFLLMSQTVSQLGDWSSRLAIALLVYDQTGSVSLPAVAVAVTFLPWVGIGQLLATLGDRFGYRRVMQASDVGRAATFLVIAAVELPVGWVLVLAFLGGLFDPPFESSRAAMVPKIVPDRDYGPALALSSFIEDAMALLGYAAGGGLVALIGPRGALAVNALSFAVSALILHGLPHVRPLLVESGTSMWRGFRRGLTGVVSDRLLVSTVAAYASVSLFAMVAEGLVAVYVVDAIGRGDAMVGLVAAAIPVGTVVGTLTLRLDGDDHHMTYLVGRMPLLAGLVAVPFFLATVDVPWVFVAFFAVGLASAAAVPASTIAGRRLPDETRATGFSILQGLVLGAHAVGAGLGAAVAVLFGVGAAMVVSAVGLVVVGGVTLVGSRLADRTDRESAPIPSSHH